MEDFWRIISGWPPFGQAIFLLIVLGMLLECFRLVCYYGAVYMRGWPPECQRDVDEDS